MSLHGETNEKQLSGFEEFERHLIRQRYSIRDPETGERPEKTYENIIDRIAGYVTSISFPISKEIIEEALRAAYQRCLTFATPALMNLGNPYGKRKGYYSCFPLGPIGDSTKEIFEYLQTASTVFQYAGGVGLDFSKLRPRHAPVDSGQGNSCLIGDTIVYRDRPVLSTKDNQITLYKLNQLTKFNLQQIKIRSFDEVRGVFFRNHILNIMDNGITSVFEVVTDKGYRIQATLNHRFMNKDCKYQFLENFVIGDIVAINGTNVNTAYIEVNSKRLCSACGQNLRYQTYSVCYSCHINLHRKTSECKLCEKRIQTGSLCCNSCFNELQKQENAGDLSKRQRQECHEYRIRHRLCEICGIGEQNARIEIHHKDFDPGNNNHSNLIALCRQCHVNTHSRQEFLGNPYRHKYLDFDKIISIKYVGEKQVFDLQMEGPNHNFIANGFISHNSGPAGFIPLFEAAAQCISQGGKRRGAMLGQIDYDHSDILEIVNLKRENRNLQSINISINAFGDFWEKKELIKQIAQSMWISGDPGLLFTDNMSQNSPYPVNLKPLAKYVNPCVVGDTLLRSPCGDIKIKDLVESGVQEIPVYCCNPRTGELAIKIGRNPRKTSTNKKVLKITFSRGKSGSDFIIVTEDHKFLRDTLYEVAAKDLIRGDRIKSFSKYSYSTGCQVPIEEYYVLSNGHEIRESHFVLEWKEGCKINWGRHSGCYHAHHKDENHLNNHPDNLEAILAYDHFVYHSTGEKNPRYGQNVSEETKSKMSFAAREWRTKDALHLASRFLSEGICIDSPSDWRKIDNAYPSVETIFNYFDNWNDFLRAASEFNHIVMLIEPWGEEDVYNITVDDYHTVAWNSIITLNCSEYTSLPFSSCNLLTVNTLKCSPSYSDFEELGYYATHLGNMILWITLTREGEGLPKESIHFENFYDTLRTIRPVGVGLAGLAEYLYMNKCEYGDIFTLKKIYDALARGTLKASGEWYMATKTEAEWDPTYKDKHLSEIGYSGSTRFWNTTTLCQAPTGSVSQFLRCISTGIEPFTSFSVKRQFIDTETNNLRTVTLDSTVPKTCELKHISWETQLEVTAAIQSWLHTSASKTINVPKETPVNDIEQLIWAAKSKELKGLTVFREGCSLESIVSSSGNDDGVAPLSDCLQSAKYKFKGQSSVYIFITYDPSEPSSPKEVFIEVGKSGTKINSLCNGIARQASLALRSGTRPEMIIKSLSGNDDGDFLVNSRCGRATSIPDAVALALQDFIGQDIATDEVYDICPVCHKHTFSRSGQGCKTCQKCGHSTC
jgi:ribonucleoside-diphosphate reductase alpha chain